MKRHQRTLVALSASDSDRPLIAYARNLSKLRFTQHFNFTHVCTPARMAAENRTIDEIRRDCNNMLAAAFDDVGENIGVSCDVLEGVRIDALLESIEKHNCDMVLLGHRHARSGQRSLARRLAMIAPCSVWLLPEGAPMSISKIMVPIDFSDHSADSLAVAASIAGAAGLSELRATHVYSDPAMIRYDESIQELRQDEQRVFREFLRNVETHGMKVCPELIEGNIVAGTILHAADQYGADLLVMNTRGRSRSASILLGSVTSQVMAETPIAFLAVKHYGAAMNLLEALRQSQIWARKNPKTN